MHINAKELQERVHNNRNPKEYIHYYNNYGEREKLKQIRYERKHLGNFEKIPLILKDPDTGKTFKNFINIGRGSSQTDSYRDVRLPVDLSDFQSDIELSTEEESRPPRIIDTIDESENEDTKTNYRIKGYSKSPAVKKQVSLK